MTVETLSPAQRQLYDAIQAGKDKDTCISELGLTEGTFAAQCTRIRNKGIQLPGLPGHSGQSSSFEKPISRPASTGPGSSESVLNEVSKAGPAIYDVEATIRKAQEQGSVHGDMATLHPMAVMGLTIQFMRLCGGRFHAHQVIEDVYGAVRTFTHDGPSADDVVEAATKSFTPQSGLTEDDLEEFLDKAGSIKGELEELLSRALPQTARTV
jgi:hypothetical protein